MKRRFMAILLAGGLVLGLCGCGGGSSTAAPAPSSTEQEGASAENNLPDTSAQENATANDLASTAPDAERYTADELVNLWSSGILTKEDIAYKTATGEISYEVYEEFLDLMAGDEEFEASQSEEIPEKISEDGAPSIDIDISKLLATHVVEFEDVDGYTIRETCQLSPIFREDDRETMYALWEALGQDVASFPSEKSLYDKNYLLRDARDSASCNKLEYIIGTYMIENRTDGFPITPDNPRTYSSRLAAQRVSAFDEEHDGTAADFFNWRYVSVVMYSNGAVYYDEEDAGNHEVILGVPKMESDLWGPRTFVIALPNGNTPNRPDGYRYDKIRLQFGCLSSPYSNDDGFELTYFED